MTLFLIRHGRAGVRDGHNPGDEQRPLDALGNEQAAALARNWGSSEIGAVHSSPALRCVQTVEPLAHRFGLTVEIAPQLFEGASTSRSIEFVRSFTNRNVVLCSHGDVIPEILRMLETGGSRLTGRGCAKGSVWMLDNSTERIEAATYLGPVSLPA